MSLRDWDAFVAMAQLHDRRVNTSHTNGRHPSVYICEGGMSRHVTWDEDEYRPFCTWIYSDGTKSVKWAEGEPLDWLIWLFRPQS